MNDNLGISKRFFRGKALKFLSYRIPFSRPMLAGLISFQIIATLHVYMDTRSLRIKALSVQNAGYITTPSGVVLDQLLSIVNAFKGALLLMLSTGVGLGFLSILCYWVWYRFFRLKLWFRFIPLALWIGFNIGAYLLGSSLAALIYFLAIPIVVWGVCCLEPKGLLKNCASSVWRFHLPLLLIMTFVVTLQLNNGAFLQIRDRFLLSNPPGRAISNFYYRYCLYSAEVLKPDSLKTIKSFRFSNDPPDSIKQRLTNILSVYDYYYLDSDVTHDLQLSVESDSLEFFKQDQLIFAVSLEQFIQDPDPWLAEYSEKTDENWLLRESAYLFLITSTPLLLYLVLFQVIRLMFSLLSGDQLPGYLTKTVFTISIILIFWHFYSDDRSDFRANQLVTRLQSKHSAERIQALKTIIRYKLNLDDYRNGRLRLSAENLAEQYWLVKASHFSKKRKTKHHLVDLLKHKEPIIICQALSALGKRPEKSVTFYINKVLQTTDHWYVQWYAYQALKKRVL